MARETKTLDVEWSVRKGAADSGTLTGYASTFGNIDRQGDVVAPGAFADTIKHLRANGGIPLLADHNASTTSVLGTITNAREDVHGLVIEAAFSSIPSAQVVRTLLAEGHLSRLSIGYEPIDYAYEHRDGQRVRVLKAVRLWETSVVVFPANPEAAVSSVKRARNDDGAWLGDWLLASERLDQHYSRCGTGSA